MVWSSNNATPHYTSKEDNIMNVTVSYYTELMNKSTFVEKNNYEFTILSWRHFANKFNIPGNCNDNEYILLNAALKENKVCKLITTRCKPKDLSSYSDSLRKIVYTLNRLCQKKTSVKDRSPIYIMHNITPIGAPEFDYDSAYDVLNSYIKKHFIVPVCLDEAPYSVENEIFKCIIAHNCKLVFDPNKVINFFESDREDTLSTKESKDSQVIVDSVNDTVDTIGETVYNMAVEYVKNEDYNNGFRLYDKLFEAIDKLNELDDARKKRLHEF